MKKRGIELDHATIQRWVVKYTPLLETEFRKRKKAVGNTAEFRQKFSKDLLLIGSVINLGKGDDHILYELCDRTVFLHRTNVKISYKRSFSRLG